MKQKQKKTMKPRKLWSYVWRLWLVCIPVCTAMILDNIAITKRNFQENFLRNDITSSQLFNQSLWFGALSYYYFGPAIVPAYRFRLYLQMSRLQERSLVRNNNRTEHQTIKID